ncbi:MAG: PAS domain-containing protein [Janthinobacterium lividum]
MPTTLVSLPLFNALPGAYLLLSPALYIEAVTEAYLAATHTQRDHLVGRFLFDALPDRAHAPEAQAERNLRASLAQVLATRQPHEMAPQRYDLPDPTQPDCFLERYWLPRNTPVLDDQGQVTLIIHSTVDITLQVQAETRLHESQGREQALRTTAAAQAEALAATQQQMQARETFYQLFAHTPAAICIQRGPAHRFEYVNAAYQEFFPDRQLLGRPVVEALPEIGPAGLLPLLDGVYQTGETYFGHEIPLRLAQADDSPNRQRYFTFTYQAYREAGEIVGISTFAYEVTGQVLARQQGEAHQQQLRELFEQAPVAISVFRGPDYVLEVVNPLMGAMWHRAPAQLVGRPFFEALPELEAQGVRALLEEVVRTGTPCRVQEWEAPAADRASGPRFFNFVYQPLRDEHARVAAIACVATDVTDQVLARRGSEHSARELRLLADALPALIARVDRQERYVFANQAYERWYGRPAAELVGRPVREVIGERAYQRGQANRARAQAGERVDFDATNYQSRAEQHIHGSLIPAEQPGSPGGYYSLISDVTGLVEARRAAEASARRVQALADELRAANEQLTRANVDLDNFIYMATHDLRAPITNVEGLLRVLQEQVPVEGAPAGLVPQVLAMMQGAVERFQLTLTQLTDIARLQQAQALEAVDLSALVADVRLDLAPLFAETQAQLVVDVATCPRVSFTPAHLRSIVYNLLSNALKYRHPDRPAVVHLRTQCTATQAIVEVQDNGLGLDERQQAQLFRMFQRLHPHVEGTGVGLYMVKRMVENAAGTITVHSQLGVGSTFRVTLPLEAEGPA